MKTTVIGLGAMGAGIAGNLFRAGHLSHAWNRSPKRAQAAAGQHGFAIADSLENAAAQADLEALHASQCKDGWGPEERDLCALHSVDPSRSEHPEDPLATHAGAAGQAGLQHLRGAFVDVLRLRYSRPRQ